MVLSSMPISARIVATVCRRPLRVSPGDTASASRSFRRTFFQEELKPAVVHGLPWLVTQTVIASWVGDAARAARTGEGSGIQTGSFVLARRRSMRSDRIAELGNVKASFGSSPQNIMRVMGSTMWAGRFVSTAWRSLSVHDGWPGEHPWVCGCSDLERGIGGHVAALDTPAEHHRKDGLRVVAPFSAKLFGGFVTYADHKRRREPVERSIGDGFQVIETALIVRLRARGQVLEGGVVSMPGDQQPECGGFGQRPSALIHRQGRPCVICRGSSASASPNGVTLMLRFCDRQDQEQPNHEETDDCGKSYPLAATRRRCKCNDGRTQKRCRLS